MIPWLEKHYKLSFFITLIIAILIFLMSSFSFESQTIKGTTGINSIVYHITAFFLLSFFLQIFLVRQKNKELLIVSVLIAIIYGITDEVHQLFVQGRNGSVSDVFLDGIGILYAFIVYYISLIYRIKY